MNRIADPWRGETASSGGQSRAATQWPTVVSDAIPGGAARIGGAGQRAFAYHAARREHGGGDNRAIRHVVGRVSPAPTATATPRPTPSYVYPNPGNNPGKQVIINEIIAVFGPSYAQGALNIAACESGYDPNARNTYPIGNSHASGVFQILYPSTWNTTSYAAYSPFDYDKNIHAGYEIFHRDGNSWREWACKP